jgi:hypothetical protein
MRQPGRQTAICALWVSPSPSRRHVRARRRGRRRGDTATYGDDVLVSGAGETATCHEQVDRRYMSDPGRSHVRRSSAGREEARGDVQNASSRGQLGRAHNHTAWKASWPWMNVAATITADTRPASHARPGILVQGRPGPIRHSLARLALLMAERDFPHDQRRGKLAADRPVAEFERTSIRMQPGV